MRIEAAVTSISWIPSEAVTGLTKAGFTSGAMHYDDPPPGYLENLAELHKAGRFRFANHLAAWAEVEDGHVVDAGYAGRGYITSTRVSFGARGGVTFQPTEFPELRADPEVRGAEAVFSQTVGGRTGVPFPRPVRGKPFFQWVAPTVWTTLRLTISADGTSAGELTSASKFPRHWIYDSDGNLAAKSGLADYAEWTRSTFGKHTPWGDEHSRPLVTAAETALERQISTTIMRGGARPEIRKLAAGSLLAEQGQPGQEIFLLLDGVIAVSVDGTELAELGPGAILGERAALEHGLRTATLRAATDCVVAATTAGNVDLDRLRELERLHHREDAAG
jgi:Cyclic nucleotide-binding domain